MISNFDFINDIRLNDIKNACMEAEKSLTVTSSTCAIMSRKALELGIKWVYGIDGELKIPYQQTLATLIYDRTFKNIIDAVLLQKIIYIQKLGNQAVHSNIKIKKEEALLALRNLHDFMLWVTYLYCDNYVQHKFDESIIPNPENNKILEKEKIELLEKLEANEKTIEQLQKQFESLRKETSNSRKAKQNSIPYDVKDISEFKTRKQYIDLDLEIAGWEFNRNIVEELEVTGMSNTKGIGYVDYVLMGTKGKPVG